MAITERWFLIKDERVFSESLTYETRDVALAAVAELNETTPGFSCLRIPYRMTICEGCRSRLFDCIYEVGAQHLTEITWDDCPEHEYWGQNEQTPMIAAWAYGDE
ncbi:hypothetical protein ACIQHZ_31595 [Streptomyces halstedii]|uniref:hypothetical protein n=1 Tax=Streptomyces halstedii TaxID=1944 RepID=UPI00380B8CCF